MALTYRYDLNQLDEVSHPVVRTVEYSRIATIDSLGIGRLRIYRLGIDRYALVGNIGKYNKWIGMQRFVY